MVQQQSNPENIKSLSGALVVLSLLFFCNCSSSLKNHTGHSDSSSVALIEDREMASACPRSHRPCGENNKSCCPILQRDGEGSPGGDKKSIDILFVLNTLILGWYPLHFDVESRFQSFIPNMDDPSVDWRMFFINSHYSGSSEQNGRAMNLGLTGQGLSDSKILDRSVPDYPNVFMDVMIRGLKRPESGHCSTSYSSLSCFYGHPLKALMASFAANKHLTRKEASFLAIIVSNRDEEGEERRAGDIIREFQEVYGSDKKLFVWGLIIRPGDKECQYSLDHKYGNNRISNLSKHFSEAGRQIADLVKQTGGGLYNICLKDYSTVASDISTVQ